MYKCSILGCQSNSDSTDEQISVFNFPKDHTTLQKWIERVEIKGNEINKNSRICIKHFKNEDLECGDDFIRLKSDALPEPVVIENLNLAQTISEIEDEILPKFVDLKMIIEPAECICLYSLKFKSDFSDLFIPFKILINKFMETRIEQFKEEDSSWTTESCVISSISELEQIIYNHFNVDEIQEFMDTESIIEEEYVNDDIEAIEICNLEEIHVKDLKCKNCLITFKTELGLRQHMKTCLTPKIFIRDGPKPKSNKKKKVNCSHCNVLILSESLGRHIRNIHMKQKPHECTMCNKKFATASLKSAHEKTHERNVELQQYLQTKNEKSFYQCPNCRDANFDKSDLLKIHMEKNCYCPPKKRAYSYDCKYCSLKFNTKILAASHYQEVHNFIIKNPKKFCFECCDEFEDYTNHIRVHTCLFTCKICSMKFLTKDKCRSHELKHESEDADRPFACMEEDCFATFKSQHHLKSHMTSIHKSGEIERKFSCEICGDKFYSKALLTAHLRTHDSDSIFICRFCDKKFKKLSNLKIHSITTHQTDAIYVCSDCSSRFKFLHDLKSHCHEEHGKNLNIQKYFHETN